MKLYKVTAFPKHEGGGNKAGVVLEADMLTSEEKQTIAKDIGFSETAFVSLSRVADFKVEFFTPTSQVNLCGHATIATFNLLRDLGVIKEGYYTQETKAGTLKLHVQKDIVYMEQNKPEFFPKIRKEDIANCFQNEHYLHDELPVIIASTGMKEIFVPVKNVLHLDNLFPNFEEIVRVSKKFGVIGIHVFSLSETGECDAYGRNFAPLVGILEESATGTSNGALGCYLARFHDLKNEYILRQGYSMRQPSEIITKLEYKDDQISRVWVGGTAKRIN